MVAEYGIRVANAVHEIKQCTQGRIAHKVFGAETRADHRFGVGDGLGGDTLDLGQSLGDPLLFVLARHLYLGG